MTRVVKKSLEELFISHPILSRIRYYQRKFTIPILKGLGNTIDNNTDTVLSAMNMSWD